MKNIHITLHSFQKFKKEDQSVMIDLMNKLQQEDPEELPRNEEKTLKLFQRIQTHDDVRIFTIKIENTVVGYGILVFIFSVEFGGVYAEIDELYILPEYRNQGIGTQFIHYLEGQAKQLGCTASFLTVSGNNLRAQRLYEKLGYQKLARFSYLKK
jgi:ribosomal protein S18 acetylase RimI-like enzyme